MCRRIFNVDNNTVDKISKKLIGKGIKILLNFFLGRPRFLVGFADFVQTKKVENMMEETIDELLKKYIEELKFGSKSWSLYVQLQRVKEDAQLHHLRSFLYQVICGGGVDVNLFRKQDWMYYGFCTVEKISESHPCFVVKEVILE